MDIFDKLRLENSSLGQYQSAADHYFFFPKLEGEIAPRMRFYGKEMLTWSLNNYIGLANQPEVRQSDAASAAEWGLAYPMGARMMSGHTVKHEQLQNELAEFLSKESCYLLNYGYQGMVSVIDSLVDRNDVIVYDSEAHACILDGMRLHIGKRFVFRHNDMASFQKQLENANKLIEKNDTGGILVITEGVYGMMGDLANLPEIVALKQKYHFRLLVDDAHGFGTMGKTGAGIGEHFGLQNEIDLYFGTFAKSMAGIGAFITGEEHIIRYLRFNMRSQIFAKSLPMAMVEGALTRLHLLRTRDDLRTKLWNVVHALQSGLREAGFDLGDTQSPVTPVYLKGGIIEATNLLIDLRENYAIFCSVVIYPVVPKDVILLRLIPTAMHTIEDVEYTIKAFQEVQTKLQRGDYQADSFDNEWKKLKDAAMNRIVNG